MSRLLDFLTGQKRRDPLTNYGYSEASDAMQDLTDVMQPPDIDRSTINADALRQDYLYLHPVGKLLRALQGLEPAYRGVTGTGVGATQSTLEGLGMGENSSDRLGRDLMAITNQPWMLIPAIFVIGTVLLFNFVGDGLRDAADPYS